MCMWNFNLMKKIDKLQDTITYQEQYILQLEITINDKIFGTDENLERQNLKNKPKKHKK